MASSASNLHVPEQAQVVTGPALDMDDRQFAEWTTLLEHRMGLFIAPERRSFLASGLKARMRETGCDDSRQYYRRLMGGRLQAEEWSLLVDQLTVHETCFFRHESSMRLVQEMLIPAVLERRDQLLAWSVGCATGEETYSLAMMIDDCIHRLGERRQYGITGTDISLPSLQRAREGVYLMRRLKDISGDFQQKYCTRVSEKRFQINEALRKRVCFSQLNLRGLKSAPLARMNLIYCQNLLIYFDRERRLEIVNELCEFLRPGGMLVMGPGELLDWRHSKMEKVCYADTLVYRRTD
jgi:chemotaxis protein methyltransferase CheR/type IV pilus assembly protein PilK